MYIYICEVWNKCLCFIVAVIIASGPPSGTLPVASGDPWTHTNWPWNLSLGDETTIITKHIDQRFGNQRAGSEQMSSQTTRHPNVLKTKKQAPGNSRDLGMALWKMSNRIGQASAQGVSDHRLCALDNDPFLFPRAIFGKPAKELYWTAFSNKQKELEQQFL